MGNAVGYILRYRIQDVLHSIGQLLVASDDDDIRRAVEVGSISSRWISVLGLILNDAEQQLYFTLAQPEAYGFNGNGCGSACCSSGGPSQPSTHQCNDGIDNDGDGTIEASDEDCKHTPLCNDSPTHTHRYESGFHYVLTANASWCSSTNDPFGKLWARSSYNKQAFRADTGNAAFDTFTLTNDNVARPVAVKCWVF